MTKTTLFASTLLLAALATPAAAVTLDFASVRANGTLITRSAAVVGLAVHGPGRYEVKFRASVEKCAYTATPKTQGDPLDIENQDLTGRKPFFIQTAWTRNSTGLPGDLSKSVFVIIHSKDGLRVANGFDLHVTCP